MGTAHRGLRKFTQSYSRGALGPCVAEEMVEGFTAGNCLGGALKKKYNAPKIIKDECGCCGLSMFEWYQLEVFFMD